MPSKQAVALTDAHPSLGGNRAHLCQRPILDGLSSETPPLVGGTGQAASARPADETEAESKRALHRCGRR